VVVVVVVDVVEDVDVVVVTVIVGHVCMDSIFIIAFHIFKNKVLLPLLK